MPYYQQIPRCIKIEALCSAFHLPYEENYYFAGEMHDSWELVFISEGEAAIAKNNRIFNLGKGDIAFHPPMEFHRIWSEGEPFRLLVISFTVSDDAALKRLGEGIFSLNLEQQHTLKAIKDEIYDAFNVDYIFISSIGTSLLSAQSAVTKLELFLLELLNSGDYEKRRDKSPAAQQFSRIIEIMTNNLHRDLSVEDIAQLASISVSNLKKICHKYTGVGPAKHFLRLKIVRAMQLLKNGMNVTQVSDYLAFSSQSYFSSAFRRETGKPPTVYKNET